MTETAGSRDSARGDLFAALVFFAAAIFLLRNILFSPGLLFGDDWGMPATLLQAEKALEISASTWSFNNFLAFKNCNLTGLPFVAAWACLMKCGISSGALCKLLLAFIFWLAGFSLHKLLRYLGAGSAASIAGGLIYVTTPIFFNYSIMGWTFVLLACGLLPLAATYYLRAVENDDWRATIVAGLIYFLAFLQSQSIVWFPIVFFSLGFRLIKDKSSFYGYLAKTAVVFAIFLFINQFSLLQLLIVPDRAVSGADMLKSSTTVGTVAHFYPLNIIRAFGGLYNNEFESILISKELSSINFILPLLALGSVFQKHERRTTISFISILLVPFLMFELNTHRQILSHVPFSNVVRDFARFTVLTGIGYSVLAGLFLNRIFILKSSLGRWGSLFLSLLWLMSISPWYTGSLTDWRAGIGPDNRLRTKQFPVEYKVVETELSKMRLDVRALYVPIAGNYEFTEDPKYFGMYKGAWDIFAGLSPIPGAIFITDRNLGNVRYQDWISHPLDARRLSQMPGNLRYLVVRRNLAKEGEPVSTAAFEREARKYFSPVFYGNRIAVYEKRDFLPHFIVPKSFTLATNPLEAVKASSRESSWDDSRTVLGPLAACRVAELAVSAGFPPPRLEFRRIAPTKYRVRVHSARGPFLLVFNESFDPGWRVYPRRPVPAPPDLAVRGAPARNIIFGAVSDAEADAGQLRDLVREGWVTDLGRHGPVRFLSKVFHGTVQNDNLPSGAIWETWFGKHLPDQDHLSANAYANAWVVAPADIGASRPGMVVVKPDGSRDLELIVEFWPQRFFWWGAVVSLLSLFLCLGLLAWPGWGRGKEKTVRGGVLTI